MFISFQSKRENQFLIFLVIIFFLGCKPKGDSEYFNGQVAIVDCEKMDSLKGEKVEIENNYPGWFNASDSLIFIHTIIKQENFITVYNYLTGEHKGEFFIKGRGPGEFINLSKIYQIYKRDNRRMATLYSPNNEEIVVWDITNSLSKGCTQNTLISIKNISSDNKLLYGGFYLINDSTYLLGIPVYYSTTDGERYPLSMFVKVNTKTGDILQKFTLFNMPVINKNDNFFFKSNNYYSFSGVIHPDGKKYFMAMIALAQVNILNLETGELKGFRLNDTPDFSYLNNNKDKFKVYYTNVAADEQFICCLYSGKVFEKGKDFPSTDYIYVFNWEGDFVKKVYLEHNASQIAVDSKNGYILTKDDVEGIVYRYDLAAVLRN